MKKSVAVLTFIFCLITVNAFADCQLKMRVVDYPPQYFKDENGKWRGMAIELGTALLKEANCKVIFSELPWRRSLEFMMEGKVDMMLNMSYSEEREKYINFIGPARDESMVIAVLEESNFIINSLEDFKKLPKGIGIMIGASYGDTFDSKYETDQDFAKKIKPVPDLLQNIKKLKHNRLAGFIMDRYDLAYKVKTQKLYKGIKLHTFIVNQNKVFFGFSKKSVPLELLTRIQRAYIRAREKGVFKEIMKNYQ
jgi:polar amino acid transport system substrate-binding protein